MHRMFYELFNGQAKVCLCLNRKLQRLKREKENVNGALATAVGAATLLHNISFTNLPRCARHIEPIHSLPA